MAHTVLAAGYLFLRDAWGCEVFLSVVVSDDTESCVMKWRYKPHEREKVRARIRGFVRSIHDCRREASTGRFREYELCQMYGAKVSAWALR